MKLVNQKSNKIVDLVLKRLTDHKFCFQGGYGYHIYGMTDICHWCVRPEYYQQVKIKDYEYLSLKIHQRYIDINPVAEHERWGN